MRPRLDEAIHGKPSFKVRAEALLDEDLEQTLKRPGKGRPFKRGQSGNPAGRPPGIAKSKRRRTLEKRAKDIAESGLTPLEFLLSVMRDVRRAMDYRIDAAKAAAPYVHRKMPIAVEGGDPNKPIIFEASALTALAPEEKLLLLTLVEKMAQTMQLASANPAKALIEGIATKEAESDDEEKDPA